MLPFRFFCFVWAVNLLPSRAFTSPRQRYDHDNIVFATRRRENSHLFMVSTEENVNPSSSSSSSASLSSLPWNTQLPETHALPPHTFAGMVEQGMIEKFGGTQDIERILTSWRLLEQDYEHKEYVGPAHLSPHESHCHQHCHSYVPGLSIHEFWDAKNHPSLKSWTQKLEKRYKEILEEFKRVALADPDALQQQGNNIWAGALTQDASSYGADWKTLVLCDRGVWDPASILHIALFLLWLLGKHSIQQFPD